MTAAGYPLPGAVVVRPPRSRLGGRRLPLIAAAVAVFVIAMTVIGLLVRPGPTTHCGFYCGPVRSARLPDQSTYTNPRYGFSFDHDPSWNEADSSDTAVSYTSDRGPFVVRVVDGGNPANIIDDAVGRLPTSQFQGITKVAYVRAAQIGFVSGSGAVYDANYMPADGSEGQEVRIAVVTATRNGLTVVAVMFAPFDNQVQPYGLANGRYFDFPLTSFRWPGQA